MTRRCEIDSCDKKHIARGLCGAHYALLRRNGVPKKLPSHGMHKSSEYESWHGMKQRCTSRKPAYFKYYTAKGITYCQRWESFDNFIADMGLKPGPDYSLDRKDSSGNYEPSNCRWASPSQQMLNRGLQSNNRSGFPGIKVRRDYRPAKYAAQITIRGCKHNLGTYADIDEALSARLFAESYFSDAF